MDLAFIEKTTASAVGIAILVALAAWARIARPTPALDNAAVGDICAVEFPGQPIERIWIAADGRGAIVKSGAEALLIFPLGDGRVSRSLAWDQALAGKVQAGVLTLPLNDAGAPRARFAVGEAAPWPPSAGAVA